MRTILIGTKVEPSLGPEVGNWEGDLGWLKVFRIWFLGLRLTLVRVYPWVVDKGETWYPGCDAQTGSD